MIFEKLYTNENDVLNLIANAITQNKSLTLTYLNQHCFNIYNTNLKYRNLLDKKFEVFLDGVAIFLVLKLLGFTKVNRIRDMSEKFFNYFSEKRTNLFLIGGEFDENIVNKKASFLQMNIVGYHNGFYRDSDLTLIVEKIKKASPEVILIGMGVPKQEFCAEKLEDLLGSIVIICVGNYFDYIFGIQTRAPKIIRDSGLEWIYRLIVEPRRLWRRYLIGIPVFLFNILKLRFTTANMSSPKNLS